MDTTQIPKTFKLNNGNEMPVLGFGTFKIKTKEPIITAIMEAGYRHLDTAACYDNEEAVGEALQAVFA
jgi:diketogulonate reductase-like aldo/keto reductase